MSKPLKDKIALVTGGAMGIGKSACVALAREGAKVVVSDRLDDKGEETADLIRKSDGEAIFVQADVSKAIEVEALIEKTVAAYGRLDCAFNNAGIGASRPGKTAEQDEEDFDRLIRVNLKGVWLCMKYELIQMLKQGGGVIVNNSSVAGLRANQIDTVGYIASKHGVSGITATAALEYADQGIRINAVCPGFTLTPMAEKAVQHNPRIEDMMKAMVPMKRWGNTKDVDETVVWLFSDAASYITGQNIVVDGGMLAK